MPHNFFRVVSGLLMGLLGTTTTGLDNIIVTMFGMDDVGRSSNPDNMMMVRGDKKSIDDIFGRRRMNWI
eukprot:scaffold113413_cov73-Cyclotella_meneghiniana.AAC.1